MSFSTAFDACFLFQLELTQNQIVGVYGMARATVQVARNNGDNSGSSRSKYHSSNLCLFKNPKLIYGKIILNSTDLREQYENRLVHKAFHVAMLIPQQ